MDCLPLLLLWLVAPPTAETVAPPAQAAIGHPVASPWTTSPAAGQGWTTPQPAPAAAIPAAPAAGPTSALGQATTPAAGATAAPAQPLVEIVDLPGSSKSATTGPPPDAATEVMTRAISPPEGAAVAGHPVTLAEALAIVRDTDGQRAVVHAYWNAVAKIAQYNIRSRGRTILERLDARSGDELALRAARESAAAAVDEAQVAAIAAQHELGQKAFLPLAPNELPLPTDPPCAGPYETRYDELFANRPAPGQARLIHRTLPLRHTAIEHRAGAVQAAAGHLDASQAAYRLGSASLESVLSAMAAWIREENAFMRSVRDYNHDIADYATVVLTGPTDSATLVSVLIGRPPQPADEPVPLGGVITTGGPDPSGGGMASRPPNWAAPLPTLAPPEDAARAAGPGQNAGAVQPAGAVEAPGAAAPSTAPSSGTASPLRPAEETPKLLPVDEPMVPIAPRNSTTPSQPTAGDRLAEGEAPKLLVVPAETPTGMQP